MLYQYTNLDKVKNILNSDGIPLYLFADYYAIA